MVIRPVLTSVQTEIPPEFQGEKEEAGGTAKPEPEHSTLFLHELSYRSHILYIFNHGDNYCSSLSVLVFGFHM